jgi:L-threonylcarbamoyladenylate synthase
MTRTRVVTVDPQRPDREAIADAAAILVRGGLVAFPTETVYGLGAHALDAAATARIFEAKGRPATDPVIVHLASSAQLETVVRDIPALATVLATAFWPGPLTLILPKQPAIPSVVTAGLPTVAVRVPAHPVARALLERAGIPIAAPSANRFSRPSPTTAEHVREDLDGRIDLIVDGGDATIGVESTILDLTVTPPLLRRPGGVSLAALRVHLPDLQTRDDRLRDDLAQPAPGQLLRHYAPRATLTLYLGAADAVGERVARDARTAAAAGSRVGILAPEEDLIGLAPRLAAAAASGRVTVSRYGARTDDRASAHDLFRALRQLDGEEVDIILAVADEDGELSPAIVDRLSRAAEGRVVRAR